MSDKPAKPADKPKSPTVILATIGRIVHYFPKPDEVFNGEPHHAALVTRNWGTRINLHVFPDNHGSVIKTSVAHRSEVSNPEAGGFWDWPERA